MPSRPGWYEGYWKRIDKETAKKVQTTCPHCGSADTFYNERFKTWRCARCEYIFKVKGYGDQRPWWKRLFRR